MELRLGSVGNNKIREQVERLGHLCEITPQNRQGFKEEILAVITKYKLQDYKRQLKQK